MEPIYLSSMNQRKASNSFDHPPSRQGSSEGEGEGRSRDSGESSGRMAGDEKKAVAIEPDDTEAHTRIQALEGEILALREGMVFEPLALLLPQFFWRERLVPCVCA